MQKITLITVSYNSENTIRDTFESVLKQQYINYEYLIIDGKSTDNTVKIIQSYESKFKGRLKWISESDKGLYDAMNKGIKMASGDIVGMINSDDVLASPDTLQLICDAFSHNNCDGIYGDLQIRDENLSKIIRYFEPKHGNYKFGWYPPHPTLYLKKEIYKKYGCYNINYKIAADYDFMIRIMKQNIILYYIPQTLVYMRSGGVSTNGIKGYWKSFLESLKALKENKIAFPLFVNFFRTIKVFAQVFIRKN